MNKFLVKLFLIGAVCQAQDFEIASITRTMPVSMQNMGDKSGPAITIEPTILRMRAITLADAIKWAYNLKPYELVGRDGKQWSESTGMPALYYIEGHCDQATSRKDVRVMLQNLLRERAGLLSHLEEKEMIVNQVRPSVKGLSKIVTLAQAAPTENIERSVLQLSSPAAADQLQIEVQSGTMGQIANELSRMIRAPLVDNTGLGDARYDIKGWVIDLRDVGSAASLQDTIVGSLSQLGLAVSTGKDLVQVRVVDSVNDKPVAN